MIVNFLSSLILCSYVNCKSSYVGGNKVIYPTCLLAKYIAMHQIFHFKKKLHFFTVLFSNAALLQFGRLRHD